MDAEACDKRLACAVARLECLECVRVAVAVAGVGNVDCRMGAPLSGFG